MLLLLTGERHSGKTTAAALLACRLQRKGYPVDGFLAPAIYAGAKPVGFDLIHIATGKRVPFARRPDHRTAFTFSPTGLEFGRQILDHCQQQAKPDSFTIIDEFGPLELKGGGWRKHVDRQTVQGTGHLILVVRKKLVSLTKALYQQ